MTALKRKRVDYYFIGLFPLKILPLKLIFSEHQWSLSKKLHLEGRSSQRFVPCALCILKGVELSEVNSREQRTEVI